MHIAIIHAQRYMEDRVTECVRAPQMRAHVRTCARAAACEYARPRNPRHTVRALSVGVDHVWLRLAGVLLGVGVQRGHWRVEHRRCHHVGDCMRRFRPGRRATAGVERRARPVVDAARPVVRGSTADAQSLLACARTHVLALAIVIYT